MTADLRIYAVGDIHGRIDLLNELLARIEADIALRPTERPLYLFLGDYIDRGPSSRETIDRLIEHGAAKESVFLRGNHELIAVKCLSDRGLFEDRDRLGPLPRDSKCFSVLQRHVGVVGVGAKAIAIGFHLAPGVGGTACFGLFTQRSRDIRRTIGLAAAKPRQQDCG